MNKRLINKIILTTLITTVCTFNYSINTFARNKNKRIYGQNRIETSIKISQEGWKNGSKVVVIAQGYNYADALCASPLAKKYNAPIILTDAEKLDKETLKELKRLKVSKVFITGGKAVVSGEVEKQLKRLNINYVKRLHGKDRYETSVEIAKELGVTKEVFLTSSKGYADSLSVAPIAAQKGNPILFADKMQLKEPVKTYINRINPNNVYVIGGQGVITNNVVKNIKGVERITGQDRFETNKNVLERFKKQIRFDNIYVVQGAGPKGNEFADALSCSALAAQNKAPIILTYNGISESLKNFVKTNLEESTNIIAIGGESIVSKDVINQINNNGNTEENEKEEVKPSSSTGGGGGGGGSSSSSSTNSSKSNSENKSKNKNNEAFVVTSNNNKVNINISDKIATEVTIILYDSNKSLAYIGQIKLDKGKASIHTKLDNGKYYGYYKFKGKTDKIRVEFKIKNGYIEKEEKVVDKKDSLYKVEAKGKDINIEIIDIKNKNTEVTITLYDKKGSLVYIGQGQLKDGRYNFNTQLDSGEYNGFYRIVGGEKIIIEKFKVK